MRMHPNERKYAELVRNSVPIADRKNTYGDIRPDVENCSNGIAPQPNTAAERGKMTVYCGAIRHRACPGCGFSDQRHAPC